MEIQFIKKYRKWKVSDVDVFKQKKAEYLIKLGWGKEYVKEIEVKEPKVVKAKKNKK